MRASATFIGILALFLASCDLEPHIKDQDKQALAALKGPDTGSIESVLSGEAAAAVSAGDFKQAAQRYKQLVDKYPNKIEYKIGFAEALRRAGNYNASLQVTDEVLVKEPGNAAALENKGLVLMNTGEFAEAGTTFGEVMKIDPKRWRTLNGIGILFAMKGKYDGAIAYFQAALGVSTDNPSVLNNAALTYAIDRQFDRAYEAFGRAKRHLEPASVEMKHLDLNLALVYAIDGKLDEAEQTASPHLSKEALYNNMGFYSYLAKNNELAKTYLNMALTQSPTYYERAWKNLGALTGENSTMPAVDGQAATSSGSTAPQLVPAPTAVTEVPIGDIPESRILHSDGTSPYAGTDAAVTAKDDSGHDKDQVTKDEAKLKQDKEKVKEDEGKANAGETGDEDSDKKKAKKAANKKNTAKKKVKKDKTSDKEKAKKKKDDSESAQPKQDDSDNAGKEAPQINPDIVILHKPKEAEHNSEWDAVDKPQAGSDKKELPPAPEAPAPTVPVPASEN